MLITPSTPTSFEEFVVWNLMLFSLSFPILICFMTYIFFINFFPKLLCNVIINIIINLSLIVYRLNFKSSAALFYISLDVYIYIYIYIFCNSKTKLGNLENLAGIQETFPWRMHTLKEVESYNWLIQIFLF